MINRFLLKIYLYSFLDDFMFVYPIYTLLFQASGLSTFQISTLLALWAGTSLILEVPTGILADKFSRKHILIIAQFIRIAGYASWLFFHSYFGFLAGFILWGINGALKSGTFEALVYDEMKELKFEQNYEKVLGRLKLFSFIGLSLALTLGGIFASINYDVPIILSLVVLSAGIINILTFRQVDASRSTKEKRYFSFLKNALKESWSNKILLELMIAFALILGVYGAFDEYLAIIFGNYEIDLSLVGILFAINYVFYSAGSVLSGFIRTRSRILLYLMAFLSGLSLLFSGILDTKYALFLLFPAAFLVGIIEVKIVAYVQRLISSNSRATILSMKVFLQEVFVIFFTLSIGFASDQLGIRYILLITGIALIFAAALSIILKLSILPLYFFRKIK